jgi:endogenous inhibitor of DNA gyrase (YacG/DUF329 family)
MANVVRLKPARKCPICGKPATQADYPFCSPRCKDIDLNRWLSERYRVPTDEAPKEPSGDDDED